MIFQPVIPAQAGIHSPKKVDSRLRGNDRERGHKK